MKEITERMIADALDDQLHQFEQERFEMTSFLQSKIEQNLKLEMELDEIKDAYRSLEMSLNAEDLGYRQKVDMLE
jgi:regulator of replication initiation timing